MPQAAMDAMSAEAAAMREPRIGKAAMERLLGLRARARAAAARALGAPESEVALTSSTSQGIGLVCAGLDWPEGGEVITTTEEHPGLLGPLDMHETGADFYAVSGQKWLLGPQGTGALWVHPRQHDRLQPATPSYFTYADGHVGPLREGAARFDPGSLDTTVLAGFAAAMEWVEGLPGGRDAWLRDAAENTAKARVRLASVPGASVHDPGGPTSGLIALRL